MKNISLLAIAVLFAACSGNNKSSNNSEPADSLNTTTETTAAVVEEVASPKQLPVSKEVVLAAWNEYADYMDNLVPDIYLCHDIDGDGQDEIFLSNSENHVARAAFTVENGELKLITHGVYPTPGGATFSFYLGKGYLLSIVDNKGMEYTAYILNNSKIEKIAYNSFAIVGWDEEKDMPIYEFGEEGQPMMGADMDNLEPDENAKAFLNPDGLSEVFDLESWNSL